MNCSSASTIFNFPKYSSGYSQDAHEIEAAASKALKKINSLYDEIMSPREFEFDERNAVNAAEYENLSSDKKYIDFQSHYLKSCCCALRELCIKCDNFISQCSSCNRCDCSVSNAQCQTSKNYVESKNLRSVHQRLCRDGSKVKCTVPEPFSFCNKNAEWLKAKEEKIIKIKKELNNKIENELKVRVHSKPVPKSTHLPLYKQMLHEKERKKVERKEKCLEILNSTKPFNLHSQCLVKAKSSSDLTQEKLSTFKAKAVPTHILSSKVSEKLRNKEEIRKMLMNERAKDIMKQSSLPFTPRSVPHSRSMVDLNSYNKTSNKMESKKNISEITNRLYVIKCKETMNSWNKKVLQVDTCKKFSYQTSNLLEKTFSMPKKVSTEDLMPFYYFPVRMSNAALLREKQIRNEILARKEREKRQKQIEENVKNKSHIDIQFKLKTLVLPDDRQRERDEKVKNFRESQIRRRQEYKKELQEMMKRVAGQNLLLERQSKATKSIQPDNNISESESEENESEQSVASNSAGELKESATESEKSLSATES